MCFEGKWLQNRLQADKNESKSLLAVDIQGNQRGGFEFSPENYLESGISFVMFLYSNFLTLSFDYYNQGFLARFHLIYSSWRYHRS